MISSILVQVVNLQAQLASLKAQAAQSYPSGNHGSSFCSSLPHFQQQDQSCLPSGDEIKIMRTLLADQTVESESNLQIYGGASLEYNHFGGENGSSIGMQITGRKSDVDDLQSAALAYLRHS